MAPHDTAQDKERESDDFAATMQRLETLVDRLESGDLALEDSLKAFEQGVALTRDAQRRLDEAELKVRTLTEGADGGMALSSFQAPGPSSSTEDAGER
ncbi:exodeoxyribonuclease VII small subunit [Halomonas sp. V046]|uniref:exodeoxyribonuclease VII small subunit n=1 Tax=Halomonas sp. V046 TaxID=3459611 RepID=UPI00404518DF